MSEAELDLFATEYARSGFQGALNAAYRPRQDIRNVRELATFAGAKIEVPSCFICGASDWGLHQTYGALEAMPVNGCADMRGQHIVPGAGHWVQQEQPQAVTQILLRFLDDVRQAAD